MSSKSSSLQGDKKQQKPQQQQNNTMGKRLSAIKTVAQAKDVILDLRRLNQNKCVMISTLKKRLRESEGSDERVQNQVEKRCKQWQSHKELLKKDIETLLKQLADADKTVQLQRDYIVDLEGKLTERSGVIGWFKRTFSL